MKRTNWIPCTINPVRVGCYEWCHTNGEYSEYTGAVFFHWWDGKYWRWNKSVKEKFIEQDYGYWRGVAK
jgi:hypothetical protein